MWHESDKNALGAMADPSYRKERVFRNIFFGRGRYFRGSFSTNHDT